MSRAVRASFFPIDRVIELLDAAGILSDEISAEEMQARVIGTPLSDKLRRRAISRLLHGRWF